MTVLNIDDLRRQAKRTLPRFAFSYLEGGADDEQTLQDNRRVFGRWRFIPPVLTDATQRDLSVTLCGQKLAAPLFIAPTGYNGMLRFGADVMLARAAREAGIGYIQSTVSTASIEEIAAENIPRHWFQLYVLKDRAVTTGLLTRARAAGCTTARPTVHGSGEQTLRHPLPSVTITSTATKDGHWTTGASTTRAEISSPVWQTA